MARKRYWLGSRGPFFFDDAGDRAYGVETEGQIKVDTAPSAQEEVLRLADLGTLFAPADAEYVVLTLHASLPNERRLQVSGNLSLTDNGANADVIIATTSGVILTTDRYTSNQTLDADNHIVLGDTDGGVFNITLPAGIDGTNYRITNVGSSGNDLTIIPNGAELLVGTNVNFALADNETLDLVYETTEGWIA